VTPENWLFLVLGFFLGAFAVTIPLIAIHLGAKHV
jgi:hypothetical protein